MKNNLFICLLLFVTLSLFFSCNKDTQKPSTENPVSTFPEGGTVTGIYSNESLVDSFMMSQVKGRLTSQGGLSFVASNDSYQLLFFFPDVVDTGL